MFTKTIKETRNSACRTIRIQRKSIPDLRILEQLESRTLFAATLFVTAPGVPTDSTHFQNLQAALAFATAGDTVVLQAGFDAGTFVNSTLSGAAIAGLNFIQTPGAIDVGEVVTIGNGGGDPIERALVVAVTMTPSGDFFCTLANNLAFNHFGSAVTAADSPTIGINKGIMLTAEAGAVVPFNLEIWNNTTGVTLSKVNLGANSLFVDAGANNNSFSDSTFANVQLGTGSHDNTLTHNMIGSLTALGTGNSSGHDSVNQNTFTGQVVITGNDTADTGDAISNNTFTTSSGDALTLHHAHMSLLQHNTFTNSGPGASSLVIHNSDNVTVTSNTFAPTGTGCTGLSIIADGTGSTSVDVTGNVIHTTNGIAVRIAKTSAGSNLEVRLQSNDLTLNAIGVAVFGDGSSAGNVDLGGETATPTRFDASIGDNDFTTFASADATHFAIGLFNTAAAYTVFAKGNHFTPPDATVLIADSTHTPSAGGTGVVFLSDVVPPPSETLTGSVNDLAAIQSGTTTGVVASFSSNLPRVASDFTVSIDWGDGTSSFGMVVANNAGGFDVVASHQWNKSGGFTFTLTIASPDASTAVGGNATISARLLTATGQNFTTVKKTTFNGVVATFTDNLTGTAASAYKSTVTWSDGLVTAGTITKNADGSFSIQTSRTFKAAGAFIASVKVCTLDGLFSALATANGTVTNPNRKEPLCFASLKHAFRVMMQYINAHHGHAPVPSHGSCHK